MNLLKIQDALKNASDDQLMQLMQSPDSSAPSFLVLSELRRRKEMRAQQGESPDTTVAEDLASTPQTYGDREGIRSLRVPGYEDEAQAEQGDQSGIEAMREGGVVRMQRGGETPGLEDYPLLTEEEVRSGRRGLSRILEQVRPRLFTPPYQPPDPSRPLGEIIGTPPSQESFAPTINTGPSPFGEEPGSPGDIRERETTRSAPPPNVPAGQLPQSRLSFVGRGENPDFVQSDVPQPRGAVRPANASGGGAGGAGAGGAGAPIGVGGGETSGGLRGLMQRNAELFPDAMGGIRDRLREMRTDPAARKNEAINMALIEAGLRMAGSNNPRFIGALSEGAVPAVQGYSRELGQIRQEQRQDIRDEMALAKSALERMYAIGQISASELRTMTQEAGANARLRAQLAGQSAQYDRAMDLERLRGENQLNLERLRGQNRPIEYSQIGPALAATTREITDLRTRMANLGPEPPRTTTGVLGTRPNPAHERWVRDGGQALSEQLRQLEQDAAYLRGLVRPGARQAAQGGQQSTPPIIGSYTSQGGFVPAQ